MYVYICKSKGKNKEKGYRDKAIKEACATVKGKEHRFSIQFEKKKYEEGQRENRGAKFKPTQPP